MAQQVSVFCTKAKVQAPTVEYKQAEASQEPSCTCILTLHAYFDADNDGFPEMTFQETARTKKASRAAAMAKAHEFLASTTAFKKLMFAAQSPWTCLEKILLTSSIAIMADVRCHVVGAVTALDGWIPIAALVHNASMQKACKRLGESVVQQLDAFVSKLLITDAPEGLELSKDGYSVRVMFKDEEELHKRLNPGFVEGGHGSPEDALKVVCDLQGPSVPVQCVVVPADSSQPLVEKDLPSRKYYRQSLADALGAPLTAVVRVGKLQGHVREPSLEEALLKHSNVCTEKAAAAQGGTPAKRARCESTEAQDSENAPQNNMLRPAASPEVSAEGGQCKRDAFGEAVEQQAYGVHSALREQIRLADLYAAGASPDAPLNIRASFLAGVPVYGDMLCTRVRLMASPKNEDAPLYGDLPVTVRPVMHVLWDSLGVQDLFQSALSRWPCKPHGTFSMVKRMPEQYDSETWSGKPPSALLKALLALFPGHTCNVHKSEAADAAAGKGANTSPKGFSHAINITLEGRSLAAQADSGVSAAAAEEGAALDAVRKIEALMAQLMVGGERTLPAQQDASDYSRLEWETLGTGSKLPMQSVVKGEVCVAALVQGNAVEVERCLIRGRLGAHCCIPAVEDALLQMKPGAVVRLKTELPFLGHDPTGKVPRCPVEIQVKASTKQPGQSGTPAIFTPTLASQRHALALQIVKEHGCQHVVDFGCGEGSWIKMLMFDPEQSKVTSVLGVDESPVALQRGSKLVPTIQLQCRQQDELKGKTLPAVKLCEGSVTHGRLLDREGWGEWHGCDAAIACEVVEHVHNPDAFAQSLLGGLRPGVAFVSTPNMEYNKVIRFCAASEEDPCKPVGSDGHAMRDRDHKFEWSRAEFQDWCAQQAQKYGYKVSFAGVGECTDHAQWLAQAPEGSTDVGMATQVAIFKRESEGEQAAPTGSSLAAHLVYEMKQQTEEELKACAKEYMQLRKQMFDETRSGAANASDGAESLLASLSECVLNEQDFVD